MNDHAIDLIYLDGCPNADAARANLRAAVGPGPDGGAWTEWNLTSAETPPSLRRFGSPTVLVDGRDVTGGSGGATAVACRTDGAPSLEVIREALRRTPSRVRRASQDLTPDSS